MQYGHFDNEQREYVIDRVSPGFLDELYRHKGHDGGL